MVRHRADDRYRMRASCELIGGAQELGAEAMQLIVDEPPLIGDRRFDALLGPQRNISLLVSDVRPMTLIPPVLTFVSCMASR